MAARATALRSGPQSALCAFPDVQPSTPRRRPICRMTGSCPTGKRPTRSLKGWRCQAEDRPAWRPRAGGKGKAKSCFPCRHLRDLLCHTCLRLPALTAQAWSSSCSPLKQPSLYQQGSQPWTHIIPQRQRKGRARVSSRHKPSSSDAGLAHRTHEPRRCASVHSSVERKGVVQGQGISGSVRVPACGRYNTRVLMCARKHVCVRVCVRVCARTCHRHPL